MQCLPKAFRWLRLRKAGRWLHTALPGPFHPSRALPRFLCGRLSSRPRLRSGSSCRAVARGPVIRLAARACLQGAPDCGLNAPLRIRWREQLAIAELNRRSTVATEANKPSAEYNNFLQYKRDNPNYRGDRLQYQQDIKPSTDWSNYMRFREREPAVGRRFPQVSEGGPATAGQHRPEGRVGAAGGDRHRRGEGVPRYQDAGSAGATAK